MGIVKKKIIDTLVVSGFRRNRTRMTGMKQSVTDNSYKIHLIRVIRVPQNVKTGCCGILLHAGNNGAKQ